MKRSLSMGNKLTVLFGLSFLSGAHGATININSKLPSGESSVVEEVESGEFSDMVQEMVGKFGYTCCAVDAGFEEHGRHCVEAATRIGGEYRALEVCKTFHGRCISSGCTER